MTQAHERTATLSQLVGKQIKLQLFLKEMSGRDLAGKLGVSPSWVSYRLSGKQEIGLDDLFLIAKALEVELGEILTPEIVAKAGTAPATTNGHSGRMTKRTTPADRTDEPRRARFVFGPPHGPGGRDVSRPVSAVPASTRRPRSGRPSNRPKAA